MILDFRLRILDLIEANIFRMTSFEKVSSFFYSHKHYISETKFSAMDGNSLKEIKSLFENKNYSVRSDFINDYGFNDEHFDYYKSFIINAKAIKDRFYLSDLIDLSGWLNIYDESLQLKWFTHLVEPTHYLIKLAVLDYFKFCKKELLFQFYEQKLNSLLTGRNLLIVQNQILFNLSILESENTEIYKDALKKSLVKTKDWRSIYRTLNNIKEVAINGEYKNNLILIIDESSEKNDFGDGARALLTEIKLLA